MTPYTPKSGRKSPIKKFYVFFRLNSKYEGKYAVIHAGRVAKAADTALKRFGHLDVADVEAREEYAKGKIKVFKLRELTEAQNV